MSSRALNSAADRLPQAAVIEEVFWESVEKGRAESLHPALVWGTLQGWKIIGLQGEILQRGWDLVI